MSSNINHFAEGIETALSIKEALKKPVAATLGASNFEKIEIPKEITEVHLWLDKDKNETSQTEGAKATAKLQGQGFLVYQHIPQVELEDDQNKVDWLDLHNLTECNAIAESLEESSPIPLKRPDGLVCLDEVEAIETEWFSHPRLPSAKLVILEGDPGIGKSTVALKLCSEMTTGRPLFGLTPMTPINVLLLCSEDGLEDTIKPRFDKLGGDHSKIYAFKPPVLLDEEGKSTLRMLVQFSKCRCIIIDPLVALLGSGVDMHRANDVRAALSILIQLAQEFNCLIIAIRHLVKGDATKAIYKGIGSIDFTAACRSVLQIAKNPNKKNSGVIFHVKSNLAPMGEPLGYDIDEGKIVWTGVSDVKIEDTLSDYKTKDSSSLESAKTFLSDLLSNGKLSAKEIFEQGEVNGFSARTLNRAKKELSIKSDKYPDGWYWELKNQDCQGSRIETWQPYAD